METCANCGRLIADTEQRYFDNNRIVCGQCLAMLRPPTPTIGYGGVQQRANTASGLGIAALVLGILAVLFAWMPFCGMIAIPLAIVGLILGIIGLSTARKNGQGVGMPIAGTTLSAVAILFQVAFWAFFAYTVRNAPTIAATGAPGAPGISSTRPADPLLAAHYDIVTYDEALENFEQDNGRFPTNAEGLSMLVNKPPSLATWSGPYIQDYRPFDPWGNAYVYLRPGKRNKESYDIYSLGPDGKEGTADDITGSGE